MAPLPPSVGRGGYAKWAHQARCAPITTLGLMILTRLQVLYRHSKTHQISYDLPESLRRRRSRRLSSLPAAAVTGEVL